MTFPVPGMDFPPNNQSVKERCAQIAHLRITGGQSVLPLSVIQVSSGHTATDGHTARDGHTVRDGHTAPGRGASLPCTVG